MFNWYVLKITILLRSNNHFLKGKHNQVTSYLILESDLLYASIFYQLYDLIILFPISVLGNSWSKTGGKRGSYPFPNTEFSQRKPDTMNPHPLFPSYFLFQLIFLYKTIIFHFHHLTHSPQKHQTTGKQSGASRR